MLQKMMLIQSVLAVSAFAQVPVEQAPVISQGHQLACPAGTHQVGGVRSSMAKLTCTKTTVDGSRVFHGPMISFYASGRVEAVGQNTEGFRSGTWSFFDEAGHKVGETEFLRGEFHGRRVELGAEGRVLREEQWLNGKRQGLQKSFDGAGVATLTEYRDDRPVVR